MKSQIQCPYCLFPDADFCLPRKDGIPVYVCSHCRLRFALKDDLQHVYGSIEALYQKDYYEREGDIGYINYEELPLSDFLWQAAVVRLIAGGRKKCLDVGCGTGKLMALLAKKGFEIEGIEISSHAAAVASSRGLSIIGSDILSIPAEKTYDIITAFNVIEHVADIRAFLKKILNLLTDDGVFIFLVPDAGSASALSLGEKWYGYNSSLEHLYYFSVESLNYLMTEIFSTSPVLYQATLKGEDGVCGFIRKSPGYHDIELAGLLSSNFAPESITRENIIPVSILLVTLGNARVSEYCAKYASDIRRNADALELSFLGPALDISASGTDSVPLSSDFSVRLYQEGDECGIVRLFNEVFEREMTVEEWNWKYKGRGNSSVYSAVAVNSAQETVAHYGGIPHRMIYLGRDIYGLAIGDVMVHPKLRGLKLFKKTAELVPEEAVRNNIYLGYGFPNQRALRLPEKLGLYEKIEDVYEASKKICFQTTAARFYFSLSPLSFDDNRIDLLWNDVKTRLKLAVVRDRDYLSWRYQRHPFYSYELWGLQRRWGGGLLGFAVLRRDGEQMLLVDFACRFEMLKNLLRKVENYCWTAGFKRLLLWHPEFLNSSLESLGFVVGPSLTCIPRTTHELTMKKEEIKGNFFYTMGDTDFM
ncbi:MAG: GNAT family N-acetyltransferase [Nitrospirae bacterium]|nr:GNAT family N-acetyltransferase [Nitrospirota bacterium]